MFFDRQFSAPHFCAWALWLLGVVFAALDCFTQAGDDIGPIGVISALGGGTLHVIGAIREQAKREENAFVLGRDSVRSIHSQPHS